MEVIAISKKELRKARFKAKVRSAKLAVKEKVEDVKNWTRNNPDIALATATTIAVGGGKIAKTLYKNHHKKVVLDREEELKDLYCYDRSLGHYWKLRRELTNQEWLELDRRKKEGERMADILSSMNVLA